MTTTDRQVTSAPPRLNYIDRARGLAVTLMVADHALLIFAAPVWLRLGPTRAAMPIFVLLAGTLFRGRVTPRWLLVAALGVAFTVALPGMGHPNILLQIGTCALITAALPAGWVLPALVVCLTSLANFGLWLPASVSGDSYPITAVLALFLLGHSLPLHSWEWAGRLPAWLARVGRYPLTVYVGHVLGLVTLAELVRR